MEGLTFSGQILVFMLYYDLVGECNSYCPCLFSFEKNSK